MGAVSKTGKMLIDIKTLREKLWIRTITEWRKVFVKRGGRMQTECRCQRSLIHSLPL